jgi:hypothetical protein
MVVLVVIMIRNRQKLKKLKLRTETECDFDSFNTQANDRFQLQIGVIAGIYLISSVTEWCCIRIAYKEFARDNLDCIDNKWIIVASN